MRKLLVHLHLYYTDQCDYFVEKLRNIAGCEWDLHVTMVKHEPATEQKILSAFPSATISILENRGYDIRPFIQLLKSVNLDGYDYVLKLHTKSYYDKPTRVNKFWYSGYEWRNIMVDCLLKDKACFMRLLDIFEKSEKTGMVCSRLFYMAMSDFLPEDCSVLKREAYRIGLAIKSRRFLTGSIFMARTAPYKLLQSGKITADIFPCKTPTHSFGTMAHVYERILSLVINAAKLKVKTISYDRPKEIYLGIVKESIQPVIEHCFSLRREGEDRIKTLRIFWLRIPLEKKIN